MDADERVRRVNEAGFRPAGRYVLYWMRWNRRAQSNHALRFAAELANSLELPVVVLETLGCGYPYASARLHTFLLEGVSESAAAFEKLGAGYLFYASPCPEKDDHALNIVTRQAAALVTDEAPQPLPDFDLACYAVDSSCIVPAAAIPGRAFAAYSIRPKIRKLLPRFLRPVPRVRIRHPYPQSFAEFRAHSPMQIAQLVAGCRIDQSVPPSVTFRGGRAEARRRLAIFLRSRLRRYAGEKNEPSAHATSDLSPYLHCGFISSLEVALAVRAYAARHKLIADEFLEELIVRRELAFNFVRHAARADSLTELPDWARATLDRHRRDRRDPVYTRDQFARAATHDELWNAAQKELLLCGIIHGYYRMYWGKKIIEWSATPEQALAVMLELNDRYALDGQDPNSWANILWCFGLHDRPWPERPIFGTVRFMARSGMDRKTDTSAYIREIERVEHAGRKAGR